MLTSYGLGASDLLHPSQTDWTGCDCYARPNRHCRFRSHLEFVLLRRYWVNEGGVVWSAPLSQIHLQVSVSFSCFVTFKHKTNHMPVPSGLTGLQHSTYWLNHLTFTVSCFLATDAKWYIKINLRLQILQGIFSIAQSISPLLQHSTNYQILIFGSQQ